jgi:type VI protein secretion system component Hcp
VPGQNGAPGGQGPQGPAVTVANGRTLTLSGGQVLTVNGGNGVTVTSPPVNPGHVAGEARFGTGREAMTFNIAELNFATGAHGPGGGGGAGKVAVHDISITKKIDKSSPLLFKACANGKHFPTVVLTMRKAGKGQETYLTITLTNVLISSYQTGGHADQPTESLSLNFTKIEYKYAK